MAGDVEAIRETVSRLAGVRFEVMNPPPNYPPSAQNSRWYIANQESYQASKRLQSKAAWEDNEGVITIESAKLGTTSDWIAEEYGEDAAYEMVDKNLTNFASSEIQKEFDRKYPVVVQRIHDYERIVANLSSKRKVDMRLRYSGGKGLTAFYIDAEISAKHVSLDSKLKEIERNWNVLEEVYDAIRDYDSERAQGRDSRALTGF